MSKLLFGVILYIVLEINLCIIFTTLPNGIKSIKSAPNHAKRFLCMEVIWYSILAIFVATFCAVVSNTEEDRVKILIFNYIWLVAVRPVCKAVAKRL